MEILHCRGQAAFKGGRRGASEDACRLPLFRGGLPSFDDREYQKHDADDGQQERPDGPARDGPARPFVSRASHQVDDIGDGQHGP